MVGNHGPPQHYFARMFDLLNYLGLVKPSVGIPAEMLSRTAQKPPNGIHLKNKPYLGPQLFHFGIF